jgi:hypothetical protein
MSHSLKKDVKNYQIKGNKPNFNGYRIQECFIDEEIKK